MKRVLTIAGSDSSGGAGIQADLKTFVAFKVYGMSAVTAVTAQNTQGVQDIFPLPAELVKQQIRSVLDDIGADTVKIGMLATPGIVHAVADCIEDFRISKVVVDPIMRAKGGRVLLSEEARDILKERLLPLATVITPNLFEAQELTNMRVQSLEEMKSAAKELKNHGCGWVVIKGGHLSGQMEAVDVIYDGKGFEYLKAPFMTGKNTHGTGCTFSSAIAAGMAKGRAILKVFQDAKAFVTLAIDRSLSIGSGTGPVNQMIDMKNQ